MMNKTSKAAYGVYTDGSCLGNPGPGGWAAIIINEKGEKQSLGGHIDSTTNNRMEITAVIQALETIPENSAINIYTDSQYVINTMVKGWRRTANKDLWHALDSAVHTRHVSWTWVRGHSGNPGNEEADALALQHSRTPRVETTLTHLDQHGNVRMVDIGDKVATLRVATAKGKVSMRPETLSMILKGTVEKGDVLTTARIAGIMGAKHTATLIPMCHPLPLDKVDVGFEFDESKGSITITATAQTVAKTGVEMEALTAASITALTIYDMIKSVDRGMVIENIRLVRKSGGKSGDIVLDS